MFRAKIVWLFAAALWIVTLSSCDNTPTVPLPPPEGTISATTPADGYTEVFGEPGSVKEEAEVLVINVNSDHGVMEKAETDGSFYAIIEAEALDTLSIRQILDNRISEQRKITVPAE